MPIEFSNFNFVFEISKHVNKKKNFIFWKLYWTHPNIQVGHLDSFQLLRINMRILLKLFDFLSHKESFDLSQIEKICQICLLDICNFWSGIFLNLITSLSISIPSSQILFSDFVLVFCKYRDQLFNSMKTKWYREIRDNTW